MLLAESVALDGELMLVVLVILAVIALVALGVVALAAWAAYRAGRDGGSARTLMAALVGVQVLACLWLVAAAGLGSAVVTLGVAAAVQGAAYAIGSASRGRRA